MKEGKEAELPESSASMTLEKLRVQRPHAIGRLLLLARRDFLSRVARHLHERGLEAIPPTLLSLISYIDLEGTRSTELAERAGISKQAVGKIVKLAEKQGLLQRETDPSDGRAFLVKLTDSSLGHLVATHTMVSEVEKEYETLVGKKEMDTLKKSLHLIVYGSSDAEAHKEEAGRS